MPRFSSAKPDTRLITLPWATPLAEWPEDMLVALPRGISRHVVRFVRVGNAVYAMKEVLGHLALHEYRLLRDLARLDTPSVEAIGVVTDRVDVDGEPLDSMLITNHLQFSLPYRALFSRIVDPSRSESCSTIPISRRNDLHRYFRRSTPSIEIEPAMGS